MQPVPPQMPIMDSGQGFLFIPAAARATVVALFELRPRTFACEHGSQAGPAFGLAVLHTGSCCRPEFR